MAIDAVVGIPGAGKSYWAVNEAIRRWVKGYKKAREEQHRVLRTAGKLAADELANMPPPTAYQGLAANFDFNKDALVRLLRFRHRLSWREAVILASTVQVVRTIQDLLDVWNCILVFDEAQLWFNARDFALFPTEVLSFWTQHRKGGIDCILITQRYEMIDSNIRGLVANLYRARPVPWSLRLLRALGTRFGVVKDGHLPMFRYTVFMEESEGKVKTSTRGLGEAISKNSTVVLDPLVAACYATTGQFYAPSQELHKAAGTTKGKASASLGLKYDMSRFKKNLRGREPLEPGLSVDQLAECYLHGVPVSEMVMQHQAEHWSSVLSSARVRDAAPPDGGTNRAAVDSVTIPVEGSPKENPPAGTGGERGAPPHYSGGWKRGAHGT